MNKLFFGDNLNILREHIADESDMANRLLELHRVLKPTGSLYLQRAPTANIVFLYKLGDICRT
jgi:hypothetical protein